MESSFARLLDDNTREAWEIKLGPSTSYPSLREFEDFVTGHTRAWESLVSMSIKPIKDKGNPLGFQVSRMLNPVTWSQPPRLRKRK